MVPRGPLPLSLLPSQALPQPQLELQPQPQHQQHLLRPKRCTCKKQAAFSSRQLQQRGNKRCKKKEEQQAGDQAKLWWSHIPESINAAQQLNVAHVGRRMQTRSRTQAHIQAAPSAHASTSKAHSSSEET